MKKNKNIALKTDMSDMKTDMSKIVSCTSKKQNRFTFI